jgi:RNA polymerase sigma-70 factor (ECF subfamily)
MAALVLGRRRSRGQDESGSPAPGAGPGSPQRLVERAKAGDRLAFEELVRATYAETYALALRLTGDEDDACDVLQDAYLRAFRSLRGFRGDAAFSTWLYRITANCAATLLARRGRFDHEELEDDAPVADLRPGSDPEAAASAAAERDALSCALAELPPRLRTVVVLRDIYDLPHEAIAEELGISETAAKVRLHRARKKLRERLYPTADAARRAPGAPPVGDEGRPVGGGRPAPAVEDRDVRAS